MSEPWVEQYRPRTFDAVCHQSHVTSAFRQCAKTGQLPHLLLFGPQGCGKTTLIQALGHALFGSLFHERFSEINASSDRGIAVIRERVKPLAKRKISATADVPALQLIVLEEADALTRDAQAALRRVMEDCSETTRFALLCNYPSAIIAPVASRCAKYRFSALPPQLIAQRIHEISSSEGVKLSQKATDFIVQTSQGDARKAVTTLQMAAAIAPMRSGQKQVDDQVVTDMAAVLGTVDSQVVEDILKRARDEEVETEYLKFIRDIEARNLDTEELVDAVFQVVIKSECPDRTRCEVGKAFAKFGLQIARRSGEVVALEMFLLAVRMALRFK